MNRKIQAAKGLQGTLKVPGDKSISHRSIMLGAISKGETLVENCLMGGDCFSTINAFKKMGVEIDIHDTGTIRIAGKGLHGLKPPTQKLNLGNSGTTTRLLSGILSGQSFETSLDGDESLRKRPMKRIIEPLEKMGAKILSNDGKLPITIKGGSLSGIEYRLPVASAQVKSAIILASLYADSPSVIYEPATSRNHTELMLEHFGGKIDIANGKITIYPVHQLYGQNISIPGDISSAAFFITAGLICPNSSIYIKDVGINPTRTGILDVYASMGANIMVENIRKSAGELIGDLAVKHSNLKSTIIEGKLIPRLIDELPIIALAATQAYGTTIIRDAEELKVKESNRIDTVVDSLKAFGADIEATADGMIINGPTPLKGAIIDSHMDHRIAMMGAIAGLIADGETEIIGGSWVDISFPGFFDMIDKLKV